MNHLISTHLTDQVLQEALDAVNRCAQEVNQPVREYHRIFSEKCRQLPEVISRSDRMSMFIAGLQRTLFTNATQKRAEFEGKPDGLSKLAQYLTECERHNIVMLEAARGETARGRNHPERALSANSTKKTSSASSARKTKKSDVYNIDHGRHSRRSSHRGSRSSRRRLSNESSSSEELSPSSDSEDDYASAYSVELAASVRQSIDDSRAAAEEYFTPRQTDAIAVMTGHPTPMETIHQRSRQGGSPRSQRPAPPLTTRAPRANSPARIPIVCYLCFTLGHIVRDCPHREHSDSQQYQDFFINNFTKLEPWLQAYLTKQGRLPRKAPGAATVPVNAQAAVPTPPAVPAQCTPVPPTNTLRSEGGGGVTNERPQRVSFNDNVAVIENQGAEEAKNA